LGIGLAAASFVTGLVEVAGSEAQTTVGTQKLSPKITIKRAAAAI
jgi:hypothetical protein